MNFFFDRKDKSNKDKSNMPKITQVRSWQIPRIMNSPICITENIGGDVTISIFSSVDIPQCFVKEISDIFLIITKSNAPA